MRALLRVEKMHAVANQSPSTPDAKLARSSQTLSPDELRPFLKDDAMIRNSLIAASLFGLALTASQPAFAETRLVTYADLDLTTQAGNAKLDQRLKRAAKKVCGLDGKIGPLREMTVNQQCFVETLAEARHAKSKVQQPSLAAR